MGEKNLLQVVQRVVGDEEFRNRLLFTPRETIVAELGISREDYEALVALAPVLLGGGLFLLSGGDVTPDWGNWSRG